MPDLQQQFATNIQSFEVYFKDINKMDSKALTDLAVVTREGVLHYCSIIEQDAEAKKFIWVLFNNPKYVISLSIVFKNYPIGMNERLHLNNILYNMFISKNLKPELIAALKELRNSINYDGISALSGIDLPGGENTASEIAMCINSNVNPFVGIQRLNLYLINACEDTLIYDEQAIVNIYIAFYASSLTTLFEGILFDVYTQADMSNLTESQTDCYYIINNAILDILVQADSRVIYTVLKEYSITVVNLNVAYRRFSMSYLSADYQRIINVIEMLKTEGIYVP